MSETVIREVAKDVWIFSKPFKRSGLIPFGGRSTAIKLQSGGVWVLASTPLEEETKSKIDSLGPVRFIVGPDSVHHLFLADYKKAYPEAKLIAPESATENISDKTVKFDGAWGKDPEDTLYGFEDDVKHCYFAGFKNKEVAFFHPASKSLIEADLLFNLPAHEQYSKSESSPDFPLIGQLKPDTWVHSKLVSGMNDNTTLMKRAVAKVCSWDFERIIPCHGDVIEKDGQKAWRDAYKAFID